MSTFRAGTLDGRNVGSVIGIHLEDGPQIFATLLAIHKRDPENPGDVGLMLSNDEEVWVEEEWPVEIYLSQEAKFLSHMNNDLQRLVEQGATKDVDLLTYMGGR